MRTKVFTFFSDYEAVEELGHATAKEKRLSLALARRGSVDVDAPPKRRRMSEKLEDLDGQIDEARTEIQERLAAVESTMVRIVVKGLNRGEFRRLMIEHPPREGDRLDAEVGYNGDTFPDAFMQACIVRTDDNAGNPIKNEWTRWADEMVQGDWNEIFQGSLNLSMKATGNPLPR